MLNLIPSLSSHLSIRSFRELQNDRRGVTALEYGLLAGLIAVVIIGAVTTLGTNLNLIFQKISGDVGNVTAT